MRRKQLLKKKGLEELMWNGPGLRTNVTVLNLLASILKLLHVIGTNNEANKLVHQEEDQY